MDKRSDRNPHQHARMSCPYRSTAGQGSGYSKAPNTAAAREAETALQRLMQDRAAQEAKWFSAYTTPVAYPVEPKPPSPRIVAGLGNVSTTTTQSQGSKLGDAS